MSVVSVFNCATAVGSHAVRAESFPFPLSFPFAFPLPLLHEPTKPTIAITSASTRPRRICLKIPPDDDPPVSHDDRGKSVRGLRENHRMQKFSLGLVTRTAAPLAALVAVAACSGGSHNVQGHTTQAHTIADVASATRAAGAGSARGTIQGANAGSAPLQSSWVAAKDGATLDNGVATFGFVVGSKDLGNVELRWVGPVLYIGRPPQPASGIKGVGFQQLLLRPAGEREFLPMRMQYLSAIPAAFSPARLAAIMASPTAQVASRPGPKIAGSSTTEYYTSKPLFDVGPWPQASVSLWADSTGRVLKVHISSPSGGADYVVTGYKGQPAVQPPDPGKVVTATTLPPPAAAGAYAPVSSGSTNGVTWTLLRAPGTRGTDCWKWAATPPVKVLDAKADGSRCYLGAQPGDSVADATVFAVRSAPGGRYSALGIQLPKTATKATLGLAGGKLLPLTPSGNYLVWVGPPSPLPAYLGVTFSDGKKIQCFAGTNTSPDDLKTTTDRDVSAGDWSCF
jgi:hypothetical protein